MKKTIVACCLGLTSTLVWVPAQAAQDNWGQQVKKCNQENCYPGGTNRGAYVRDQARDSQKPGYAAEIHGQANPGKSHPKKFD